MEALNTLFPVLAMIAFGALSRRMGWLTPEQKNGANVLVFDLLFPVMVFNLMFTVTIDRSVALIVVYELFAFTAAVFIAKALTGFMGKEYAHITYLLMGTFEGGNVALPLYLSIRPGSSNTVILDIANCIMCFVVLPVIIARFSSGGSSSPKAILRNLFSSSFMVAVILGLSLNLLGGYRFLQATPLFSLYTGTVGQITTPIVGCILFILGYNLSINRDTLGIILRMSLVKTVLDLCLIGSFFLLFPEKAGNRDFLMAMLIFFLSPTGFGTLPVLKPAFRTQKDEELTASFMSSYIVLTLVVYIGVVILLA